MAIEGQTLIDSTRSKRLVFDFPGRMSIQYVDSSFVWYGVSIDDGKKTIKLTSDDNKWHANLSYDRKAANQMAVRGNLNGLPVHLQLNLMERSKIPLVSRGFHWVQEYPFNK
jgi:hypothetical protein